LKNLYFILIGSLIVFSCSKNRYNHLNQKPYYKIKVNLSNPNLLTSEPNSLILKSINGKTSNLRIKVWSIKDIGQSNTGSYIANDSNAVFYDLDYDFYQTIGYQKARDITDEFYNNGYEYYNQDSLYKILTDSLKNIYPKGIKIKQIDLFNDKKTVFRKAVYWLKYSEKEYYLKDFIQPNHFYRVQFGNSRYRNHVHNPQSYFDYFEFSTNEKNEIKYYLHSKVSRYIERKSTL
jgi:hypothetical protein